MGLYRIWLNPRVGKGAIGRKYPSKAYSVDVEARDLKHAKEKANRSPFWTGEITTLRSGDTSRDPYLQSSDPGRGTKFVHVYGTDVRTATVEQLHRLWNMKWAEPDTEGLRVIREEIRRRGLSPKWCAGWGNRSRRHGNATRDVPARGLKSYRYQGDYGWIMIGAKDDADALREAKRSLSRGAVTLARLQAWDGERYVAVRVHKGRARHGNAELQPGRFYGYKGHQVWLDTVPGGYFAMVQGTAIEARGKTAGEALKRLREKLDAGAANYARRHRRHRRVR